jgi:LPPG:FO 2-phospho-L-lactate transferase
VVAITPIIGGKAMKGPAAEMLRDLGHEVSAAGVAAVYEDLVDVFVLDQEDADLSEAIEQIGVRPAVTNTMMKTLGDKQRLAEFVLEEVMRDA